MALRDLASDFFYAARSLRQNMLFTAVATVSLAVGIGANTAVFTLLDRLLLCPLPVKDPQELVQLDLPGARFGSVWNDRAFSYPLYKDLVKGNQTLEALAGQLSTSASFSTKDRSEFVNSLMVTGNWFQMLGVKAASGRLIAPEDDTTIDGHPVVVLSHGFWMRRFGGQPVVNRPIILNGRQMTVLGVAEKQFRGTDMGNQPDIFVPVTMQRLMMPNWYGLENRKFYFLNLFGRRKDGVSNEQVKADLDRLTIPILEMELHDIPSPSKRFTERFLGRRFTIYPAATGNLSGRDTIETVLRVLTALVCGVLLIACANVANLMLTRATGRKREIAIRLALGANRWQLMRLVLAESLLLALIGGGAGLLAANWGMDAVLATVATQSQLVDMTPDYRVLLFTMGLSLATGLLFGLAPAVAASRPDVAPALKDEAGSISGGAGTTWLRRTLVVVQVSLSVLLLVAASLFLKTLHNLRNHNPGFDVEQLMTFTIDPTANGYKPAATVDLTERFRNELTLLPGVNSVSMAAQGMLTDSTNLSTIRVEGYQPAEDADMNPLVNHVGPDFFRTLSIPLMMGREFTEADHARAPKVAVVNRAFAKHFYGDVNPLGRKIGFMNTPTADITIVGVVEKSKHQSLRQPDDVRFVYIPSAQDNAPGSRTYYVRTSAIPGVLGTSIRTMLRRTDPNLPIDSMRTMREQMDVSLSMERMTTILCTSFGVIATLLAAVGLYGVMGFHVMRRTREIGIRLALGAQRGDVLRMVLMEAGVLAAVGIAIGVPAALVLSRFTETMLYQVEPKDPLAMAGASVFLFAVALLASFLPARRAAKVSPVQALRYE